MKTSSLCHYIALLLICFIFLLNGVAANATVDTSFNPDVEGNIVTIVPQTDGKILIGGTFNSVDGVTRNGLARLNSDGSLDADFNPSLSNGASVKNIVLQIDGRLVVSGTFSSVGEAFRPGLARFSHDGSLDTNFAPTFTRPVPGLDSIVDSIATQPDGKLIVGGKFTTVNGMERNLIARFNMDGSLDADFNPNSASPVGTNGSTINSIQPLADGKVLLRGTFDRIAGSRRDGLARLNADGSLDTAFDPNILGSVFTVEAHADGKVVVAGTNIFVDFINRGNVTRLNTDGSFDSNFNPNNVAGTVFDVVPQADGKLMLLGLFNTVDGESRNGIARLNADGSLDQAFNPNEEDVVTGTVVVPQVDGKLLLSGGIDLKRLNTDDDLQPEEIIVNDNSVTWLRGGNRVELYAATLEESLNNGITWGAPLVGSQVEGGWLFNSGNDQANALRFRGLARVGRSASSSMVIETIESGMTDSVDDELCVVITTKIDTVAVICL